MAIIKCPHCGQPVSDNAEICPHCSKQVAVWYCPECNNEIKERLKDCPYCGNPYHSFRKRVVQVPTPTVKDEAKKGKKGLRGMSAEEQNFLLFTKKPWKTIVLITIWACLGIGIFFISDSDMIGMGVFFAVMSIALLLAFIHYNKKANKTCPVCGNKGQFEDYDEYVGERQISKVLEYDRFGKPCNPYSVFGTEYQYIAHHKCKKCGHDEMKDKYSEDWNY